MVSKRLAKRKIKDSQRLAESLFSHEKWCAWRDSNSQPLGSKPSTLSVELQAHLVGGDQVEILLGRATGFEPVISCATDRRLRPLGYARHGESFKHLAVEARTAAKLWRLGPAGHRCNRLEYVSKWACLLQGVAASAGAPPQIKYPGCSSAFHSNSTVRLPKIGLG